MRPPLTGNLNAVRTSRSKPVEMGAGVLDDQWTHVGLHSLGRTWNPQPLCY